MKTYKVTLIILVLFVLLGFFIPIIPWLTKAGFNGKGGEFCGIVYNPGCDKLVIKLLTWSDISYIITH